MIEQILDNSQDFSIENYTQDILTEILKQMIDNFTLSDLKNSEILDAVTYELQRIKKINPKFIDNGKLIGNLLEYSANNFLDEIDKLLITDIVNTITLSLLARKKENEVTIDLLN